MGVIRARWRSALAALGAVAFLAGAVAAPAGALPNTSSPKLQLNRTIRTNPFTQTSTKMKDGEGSAYVAADDSLWLAEDVADQAYEVNPATGALKRVITQSEFAAAPGFGGGGPAGPNRIQDLESMAYDAQTDTLYAFSGKCCTSTVLPTAFRLKRGGDRKLYVESYQALPSGSDFTASAVNPADGKLYVGVNGSVRQYTYATNTIGASISISGVSGILGMSFSDDGADLLIASTQTRLFRANWSTKSVMSGWSFNLSSFGMGDTRAVELINGQFYVLDGYDSRSSSDPLKYAVYVFDVLGPGTPPSTSFTGTPTSGTSPLTVSFTDTSTGSPTSWSWNFGDGDTSTLKNPSHAYSAAGTYSVTLTSGNAGGSNTFTRANYVVVTEVDATPPDTFIDSGPSGTTSSTSATFTFSASEPSTFACALDGGAFVACSSPQSYSGLSATTHTFQVRASDTATNPDPSPATRTWTVGTAPDVTPPDTFIDSGPSGTTTSTSATLTFSASEPSTFACALDGGAFVPCSSPQSYSGLSATTHTFQVRATDTATNPDPSPATRTWTVATGTGQITRQTTSTAVNTTASNAITIPTPAGTSAGDVLVACVAMNGGTVSSVPSGWAPIAAVTSIANPHVYGYYKVAGAYEATPTWTLSGSVANGGGIARYSGVSNVSPLDGAPATGTSAAAVTVAGVPGVTTVSPNAMVVGCVGINSSSAAVTIATPGDLVEAWDIGGKRHELADGLQGSAGPSGTKSWTLSAAREFAGWVAALRPA